MDETIYWLSSVPDNNGSGGSVSIGGGGGGNSSSSGSGESSASASGIFNNDAFSEDSWKMTDYLLEDILGDCMGEALYNGIKEKLNGDKITLRFTEAAGSSYSWNSKTLNMSVNQLESNVLFHEMFHLYQTLSEPEQSFESSLLNREIEAHYAQYLFRKKQSFLFDIETDSIYLKDKRLLATRSLEMYIDDNGIIRDGIEPIVLETYLEFTVATVFRERGYDNYPFNNTTLEQTFNIINELTKNCNP